MVPAIISDSCLLTCFGGRVLCLARLLGTFSQHFKERVKYLSWEALWNTGGSWRQALLQHPRSRNMQNWPWTEIQKHLHSVHQPWSCAAGGWPQTALGVFNIPWTTRSMRYILMAQSSRGRGIFQHFQIKPDKRVNQGNWRVSHRGGRALYESTNRDNAAESAEPEVYKTGNWVVKHEGRTYSGKICTISSGNVEELKVNMMHITENWVSPWPTDFMIECIFQVW